VPAAPIADHPQSVVRNFESTQFDATLAMLSYSSRDDRYAASTVLAEVLGGGTASRLFSRVREDLGLVYDIRSEVTTFRDAGAITVSTYCGRRNLEPTLNAVFDVLDDLAANGITPEELDRARGLARFSADYLLDRPFELAEWYGRIELLDEPGGLLDPKLEAERIANVEMKDVERVIDDVLRPSNRYLAIIGPLQGRQKRHVEALFRRRADARNGRGGA
jgi:predicted Zn-dependent peptidase